MRTFVPDQDVFEAVEDAFRDMWGRPRGTFERFVEITGRESFDPSLWFLAMDGEEIAGLTLGKDSARATRGPGGPLRELLDLHHEGEGLHFIRASR